MKIRLDWVHRGGYDEWDLVNKINPGLCWPEDKLKDHIKDAHAVHKTMIHDNDEYHVLEEELEHGKTWNLVCLWSDMNYKTPVIVHIDGKKRDFKDFTSFLKVVVYAECYQRHAREMIDNTIEALKPKQ